MGKRIKIRPKDGLKVPKPLSKRFLRAEGEDVEQTSYWIRRINEGAVELVDEKNSSPKTSPKKESVKAEKKESKNKTTQKKKADQEDES